MRPLWERLSDTIKVKHRMPNWDTFVWSMKRRSARGDDDIRCSMREVIETASTFYVQNLCRSNILRIAVSGREGMPCHCEDERHVSCRNVTTSDYPMLIRDSSVSACQSMYGYFLRTGTQPRETQ